LCFRRIAMAEILSGALKENQFIAYRIAFSGARG
jgi:hypothetical protein